MAHSRLEDTPARSPVVATHTPDLPLELWRKIMKYLSPSDVKNIWPISRGLYYATSEMWFKNLNLYFLDDEGAQRSEEMLRRISTCRFLADCVRTFRISCRPRGWPPRPFTNGVVYDLMRNMYKLHSLNLAMNWSDIRPVLQVLSEAAMQDNIPLHRLSLAPEDGDGSTGWRIPNFRNITHFSFVSSSGNPEGIIEFLEQHTTTIRSLALRNLHWELPIKAISMQNLTYLDFLGTITRDSCVIADILQNGHRLVWLRLECVLQCPVAGQFRESPSGLPSLLHLSFALVDSDTNVEDPDLFHAIAYFLQHHSDLRSLHLSAPDALVGERSARRRIGYDLHLAREVIALKNLTGLNMTVWAGLLPFLVTGRPRFGMKAMSFRAVISTESPKPEALDLVRIAVPRSFGFIGLSQLHIQDVRAVIETDFPTVRVALIDGEYYNVSREDGVLQITKRPEIKTRFNIRKWLEQYECEDAEWLDASEIS